MAAERHSPSGPLADILDGPKPFLIVAAPASGTSWMCRVLYEAGAPTHHEVLNYHRVQQGRSANLMTWYFDRNREVLPRARNGEGEMPDWQAVWHQVRDPLPHVYSLCALHSQKNGLDAFWDSLEIPCHEDPMVASMQAIIRFHERAAYWTPSWYRVEDVKWPLGRVGIHNGKIGDRREPSWKELWSHDPTEASRLAALAEKYGYLDVAP